MLIRDSAQSASGGIGLSTVWTAKERIWLPAQRRSVWVPVHSRKNIHTNYGLTAYASGFQGSYVAPVYLVIETFNPKIQNATLPAASTSVQTDKQVHQTGDTQLILGVGTANQETVTWTAVSGTGPYTYTISSTTKSHNQFDWVVRLPLVTDTMTNVVSESEYDHTNAPNKRMQSVGGYSSGNANWVMQFFFNDAQGLLDFITLGLSDNNTVGAGNLHNHLAFGYTHTSGNDLEIDVSLTLSNV